MMKNLVGRLVKEEEGQGLTEYGLLVGLIALGVIATIATLGDQIAKVFTDITTTLTNNGLTDGK
jgi:pilus assembly protein Flp/PilA